MSKPKKFNRKAFLIQGLRRMSYRYPSRTSAIKKARVGRNQYKCASCGKIVKSKEFVMDHVIPVVPPEIGFTDWNAYIEGMFPEDESGWQVLCKIGELSCNAKKTLAENVIRKEQRALKKPKKKAQRRGKK